MRGTTGDRYAIRGHSGQRRLEITQAQGEMAGVPSPELLGRPLRAKLLRASGFGLHHDVDLRGSEPEVGAGKGEVGRTVDLGHAEHISVEVTGRLEVRHVERDVVQGDALI
jgi:hypothetical protein